jgi:hypothetical protein
MNEIQAGIDAIADYGRESLFFLAHDILKMKDVNQETHGKMLAALESGSTRKLINMPRGTLKSSIGCVAYPIWRLINDPNDRILLDSELYSNSKTFLREIKLHISSPLLVKLYGEFKGETWNESEIIIKQRTKPYKEASITVSGIGATKVGQHYQTIIGDDYCSPNNQNTPENSEKVIAHYRYNQSILEPGGTYVVIGTRYSERDIIAHILDNEVNIQGES